MIVDAEEGQFYDPEPNHSGVWYKYYVGDEDSIYGTLRYEIIPYAAIVHANPIQGITKSRLKELKKINNELLEQVVQDIWGFEEVFVITKDNFLVKFFSNNECKQVGSVDGMPIYIATIKDVLCHKQSSL